MIISIVSHFAPQQYENGSLKQFIDGSPLPFQGSRHRHRISSWRRKATPKVPDPPVTVNV